MHLRPPRNWINDPNGLVFHDGHYHVFFQYNPYGPRHSNVHWGHYRSPDLINWEPLPVALAPTPGGHDADGCFSGNAVSADDRMVAFYSAHRTDRWWQPVTTAESYDSGITWAKRPELLIPEPPADTTMYRDPYVWQQDDRWRMLVGSALADGRAAAQLYESDDLEHWEYRGPFHTSDATAGTGPVGWECPQYATFGDRSVLILSDWTPQGGPSHTTVHTGREQHGRFTPTACPAPLDHGPDFYAPALLKAPGEDRWLLWGWAWEARDDAWAHEAGWAGVLTLPREVTLTADGTVVQRPARELLALRGERVLHRTGHVTQSESAELGQVSRTFDLTAVLTPDTTGTSGLRLVTSADSTEYLDISLDPATGHLTVDRSHASPDARARGGSYAVPCPAARAGTPVELRVIVDRSIAEIYLADGQVLTLRFYPLADGPWRMQARTTGTGRSDFTVEAWNLTPGGIRQEPLLASQGQNT
ncbi:glycoside hydrolase family 32 protein [Streptomyces sp. NPDC059866]|uniref:glycoside hydrolase family 32 protein n=1 Tax=Streptomyces sp. NPDC059866 TaxID=3346978 RepID=UPI003669D489